MTKPSTLKKHLNKTKHGKFKIGEMYKFQQTIESNSHVMPWHFPSFGEIIFLTDTDFNLDLVLQCERVVKTYLNEDTHKPGFLIQTYKTTKKIREVYIYFKVVMSNEQHRFNIGRTLTFRSSDPQIRSIIKI